MFLQAFFGAEYPRAVVTSVPVLLLFVRQAQLSVVGGPSSEAPAAFNLVCMCVAVVKMLPKSSRFKSPATAFVHCGRVLKKEQQATLKLCRTVEDIL